MRTKSFYMGIGIINFLFLSAHAMLTEEINPKFPSLHRQGIEIERQSINTGNLPTGSKEQKNNTSLSEPEENNPNCHLILSKTKDVEKSLQDYEKRKNQIPLAEIERYRSYLKELRNLHTRAKTDKKMNVRQELYFTAQKYF